jgi:hypothetical protein
MTESLWIIILTLRKKWLLSAIILMLAMEGCSERDHAGNSAPSESKLASVPKKVPTQFLAYEYALQLLVDADNLPVVYADAQSVCRQAQSDQCVITESHLNTGRNITAGISFRAKPEGVKKLTSFLISKGTVVSQSVTSEDLASPILDSNEKLAILSDYRAKLATLRGSANVDVDALIKVNKELAEVQGEIESLSGDRAHLLQRVETEVLKVNIESTESKSFWRPVLNAFSNFGSNLSEGVSDAVSGVAYLSPWGVLIVLGWALRRWWRSKKCAKPL